jgi:hypothetical protein
MKNSSSLKDIDLADLVDVENTVFLKILIP